MTSYPDIAPVPRHVERPFVSVMIPTYNCAGYLEHTLESVLAHAWSAGQMHIEVVDDRSWADNPEGVVWKTARRRASFFRQPVNLGPQANFTDCVRRATGEWVHVLHGDDMVADGFYDALRHAAEAAPEIHAFFCGVTTIDEHNRTLDSLDFGPTTPGIVADLINQLAVQNLIMFPSIVVRRRAYEALGGFHPALFHAADWDMLKRIAVHYPVWYEPRRLALYRIHSQSDTSRLMQTGANIADARHAIEIAAAYLPGETSAQLTASARRYHGLYAMELAKEMAAAGRWRSCWGQLFEGMRCCRERAIWTAAMSTVSTAAATARRQWTGRGEAAVSAPADRDRSSC